VEADVGHLFTEEEM